ncbi:F-box protein CPR30-like [Chenopodium quinoa]|uniref:F-box protein CPR30-like n=1 Tax=Chenopodium quinoa TaxID=63459 RepID=UPI000B776283|nr:F-box protein CPR30-like [Chenopodium quinoa]
MSSIPVDVITDILLRLLAKSLLRFKCVCKLWFNIINSSDFINPHVEQSNLHIIVTNPAVYICDFDKFDNPTKLNYPLKNLEYGGLYIVGSSRGLLCFSMHSYPYTTFMYNPTTQTHKSLPYLPVLSTFQTPNGDPFHGLLGFGYDHVSEDYKCVKIHQCDADDGSGSFKSQVMVYSLREDSWKRGVHDVPYYFDSHLGYSILLNGILHWSTEDDHREPLPLVGFNLNDETFSSVPLPDYHTEEESRMRAHIGVVDACLCLMYNYWCYCEVWIMKEYGVPASWTKLCMVAKQGNYNDLRPLSFSKSKKELFVILTKANVASLDLETLEIKNIQPPGLHRLWKAYVCSENLLMLKDAEYIRKGTQQLQNRSTKMRKLLMRKTERIMRFLDEGLRNDFGIPRPSNEQS